jgi:mono/diheme cytochrome c family protein
LAAIGACTKSCDRSAADSNKPADPIQKGKTVYLANCISCHNIDPKLDGSVGPAVYGSSLELLKLRVLGRTYPEGYTPKRQTHLMPIMPYLEPQLTDLHAYLNQ